VREDVTSIWVVQSPIEGERACEELRAHGIKCACVEEAADPTSLSFYGSSLDGANNGRELAIVVAAFDAVRAATILERWDER
jgi:hypothetical protein